MSVLLSLIAFCTLGWAIDATQLIAIPLVLIAYALLVSASAPWWRQPSVSGGMRRVWRAGPPIAAALAMASLMVSAQTRAYLPQGVQSWLVVAGVAIGLLVVDYLVDRPTTRRLRCPLFLLLYTLLGAWVILGSPQPGIDVWHFQQNAAQAMLEGQHPYDISMPNPYDDTEFYGPGVVRDGQVYGFPYPPLSLLLVLPGYLLGDVRWVMLAAHLVLAGVMVAIARQRGFPAGHRVELIPLALLARPGSLLVVQLAWTESLFAAAMAVLVLVCLTNRSWLRPLALAAAWSIKQYSILLPWPLWQSGAFRLRDFVVAAIVTAGCMLPFFVWGFEETWYSIVEFQFLQPTRADSFSLNAILLHGGREPLPTWFSLASVILVGAWVSSDRSSLRPNMSLTSAAVLMTLFVTTNAFINYLWVASALLAVGIVAGFPVDVVSKSSRSIGRGLAAGGSR